MFLCDPIQVENKVHRIRLISGMLSLTTFCYLIMVPLIAHERESVLCKLAGREEGVGSVVAMSYSVLQMSPSLVIPYIYYRVAQIRKIKRE